MKITKINEPKPWEGSHGTMYKALMEFDDNPSGYVNMTKPDRWKIGDEIEITDRQVNEKYGDQLKISKPGMKASFDSPSASTVSGKFDPEIQWKIDTSWAITSAINILGDTAKGHSKDGGLIATAKHLLTLREGMINDLKDAKE